MKATEPSWTLVLQRSVFFWIVGGAVLLGSVIGGSVLIMSLISKNSDSWLVGLAGALYYSFFLGSFVAAHGFLVVSILGLLVLPFRSIRYKALTLGVCVVGLIIALQVLVPTYLNRPFLWA